MLTDLRSCVKVVGGRPYGLCSVQFKMVFMRSENPIYAPPRLSSFPNVAFGTVPVFV